MKLLDFYDIREIAKNISYSTLFKWVEYALINKESFDMPAKTRIHQGSDYFAVMPCLYEKENVLGVKTIGRHERKDKNDLRPTMMSEISIYDSSTGVLKAVMDCEYITTLRTGLSAAHSAILFSKKDYYSLGLIGIGNIMCVFLNAFLECYDNRKLLIKVFKHNNQEKRVESIVKKYKDEKNLDIIVEYYDCYDEICNNTDIIVSAVTKVEDNFCKDEAYKEGCTIIPICTKGFLNCDLFFDKIFTDEVEQIKDFKYFKFFKSVDNVTDVLNGKVSGRTSDKERILVYNYGLAIHDIFFAKKFLDLSIKEDSNYSFCKDKFFVY